MRRDLIFFIHGVPKDFLVFERDYFLAAVEPEIIKEVEALGERYPEILQLTKRSKGEFRCAAFRNDFQTLEEAFSDAYERLSGILDGYSFLVEDETPEVWPVLQVREAEKADAVIKLFEVRGWARLHSKDGSAEKTWHERTNQLLRKFLVFFDIVATRNPKFETELCDQIELSANMYRHGRLSHAYGIEYLCKFTALEGLVCGSLRVDRTRTLKKRLNSLFCRQPAVEKTVEKLWVLRCEASHQGKAFSNEFAQALPDLEAFALGALVFALDHVAAVRTTAELWTKASEYVLPPEAAMQRPAETPRYAILSAFLNTGLEWKNAGRIADAIFAKLQPPAANDSSRSRATT